MEEKRTTGQKYNVRICYEAIHLTVQRSSVSITLVLLTVTVNALHLRRCANGH